MSDAIYLKTGVPALDGLFTLVKSFLDDNVVEMNLDGDAVRGFLGPDQRSLWLRSHADTLRAGRYFLEDVTSAVQHFADTQSVHGRIFEGVSTLPLHLPDGWENRTRYVRAPVTPDVEYRFIQAAYLAWQASGDDAWMLALLPRMEKALDYIHNHEWYWNADEGLVKRALTLDSWDFAYTGESHNGLQCQVDEDTIWGLMHGDNSGYFQAFRIMSSLYQHFGDSFRARSWKDRATRLRERMNARCWNGSFYTHFVELAPGEMAELDDPARLSLSNPADVNRGAANHEMAVSILEEYRRRRTETEAFAEWFSMDPPFPDGKFGDPRMVGGAWVNGGIMPLVGGELARAAFQHGFEEYGVDILLRYHALIAETGESYLWYFPDGGHPQGEESLPSPPHPRDGWGSSAMLWALLGGLAGIEDLGKGFHPLKLSPRWPAAGVDNAQIRLQYPASGVGCGYSYQAGESELTMMVEAPGSDVSFHLLLPPESEPTMVQVDGMETPFRIRSVRESRYLDFFAVVNGETEVRIQLGETGS